MPETPDDLLRTGDVARQGFRSGPRCGATSKQKKRAWPDDQTKWRCSNVCVAGMRVCRFHGGKLGKKKAGRYSAQLVSLKEHYVSALKDDSMLDLREPLSVLEAITKRSIERAEARDTPEFRARLFKLLDDARRISATNPDDAARLMSEAYTLARDGAEEDRALKFMRDSVMAQSERIEAAWKIRLQQGSVINARDLVGILTQFIDFVTQEGGTDVAVRVATRMQANVTGDLMLRDTSDLDQFDQPIVEAAEEHEGVDAGNEDSDDVADDVAPEET